MFEYQRVGKYVFFCRSFLGFLCFVFLAVFFWGLSWEHHMISWNQITRNRNEVSAGISL